MTTLTPATLIDYLEQGRAAERAWADSLTPAERDEIGTRERWAPKDTLVHVTAWKAVLAAQLAAARQGQPHLDDEAWQAFNDETFDRWRDVPLHDITAEADRQTQALEDEIVTLPDVALTTPGYYEWLEPQTLAGRVLGTALWHIYEHLTASYSERGLLDHANRLMVEQERMARVVNSTERGLGTNLYNIACGYALMGRSREAMPLLREAFMLRPDLKEWARQDTDLDSLREMAAFQAL